VRRGRPALFLLCAAAFMAVADTTIVSTALPSIKRELGFSGAGAQWILNGFTSPSAASCSWRPGRGL